MIKWSMLTLFFFLASCQTSIEEVDPEVEMGYETSIIINEAKDQLAAQVAKNLAKSLTNLEVRNFIKEKVLDQFDGDYNFLIEVNKGNKVAVSKNGRTASLSFGNIISGANYNSSARTSNSAFLDSLSTIYPLLQVAVPSLSNGNAESWNTGSEVPLVAFVPTNYEASGVLPAYDINGNYYELNAKDEPEKLTIVISENERFMVFEKESTNANGRSQQIYPILDDCPIMQEAYYENEQSLYYLRSDVFEETNLCTGGGRYGGGGTGGGTGGGSGNSSCDRDRKSGKDRLHRMIFNSMGDYRDANEWFDGGQDLEVTIFFGQANGAIAKVTKGFSGRDKDFKDCGLFSCDPEWFGLGDVEIITWDKDIYGSAMLYSWIEKDGGSTIELNSGFSSTYDNDDGSKTTQSFSTKSTIQDKDDILYESVVEYCDNTDGNGYTYNTGKIKFQVRQ